MANNKLAITEVDFNNLKSSLRSFLQSQSEFTDLDFEGSGMNILLDLLAYNTHYSSFHANMVANEMFLDSASLRASVVSIAKHLNFIPSSYTAPTATLDILFNPTVAPSIITIEKNTKFTTSIDGTTYTFVTLDTTSIPPVNGVFLINGLGIKEGILLTYDIVNDDSDSSQRFIIPNKKVDIETIKVIIQNSISDTTQTVFTRADKISNITATSQVFWVNEVGGELYQLEFGNGVIGKALDDGNVIKIEYLVTNGDAANKASTFSAEGDIGGYNGNEVSFTVSQNSAGGDNIQSIEDIKFLAPKLFSTQGRAVTAQDYVNILLEERTDIESITAWGGEDNIPPRFGEVFIAIKPKNSLTYSTSTKLDIETNILKSRNIVAITPTIVDAEFTYVKMAVDVIYDSLQLSGTVVDLQNSIQSVIEDYYIETLSKFDKKLRTSVLTALIDNVNGSVLNSRSTYSIENRFEPTLTIPESQTILFNNAIKENSLSSNTFTVGTDTSLFYSDDGVGKMTLKQLVGTVTTVIDSDVGTVDYSSGTINLTNNTIAAIDDGTFIKISATPVIADIVPMNGQILTMDTTESSSLTITMISDEI